MLWRNLKGPRDKDLMGTAEALDLLRAGPEYRSIKELAAAAKVSREIVREFLSLLKLPETVRERFRSGELRTLEQGRRLYQLQLHRPAVVEEAADAMASLDAHQSRALADFLLRNANADVPTAVEAIAKDRTRVRSEVHIVAELSDSEYRALRREARRARVNEVQLVTKIVKEWLAGREPRDG